MKCVNCGEDLPNDALFCPFCGADNRSQINEPEQEEWQEEPYAQPVPPQPPLQETAADGNFMLLKVGASVLAVLYVIFGVVAVFGGMVSFLGSMGYRFSFLMFFGSVFNIAKGACFVLMAMVLLLLGFTKKNENRKPLFAASLFVGVTAVFLALARMVFLLLYSYRYYGYISGTVVRAIILPLFGAILALGILYALMYVEKTAPAAADFKRMGSLKGCVNAVSDSARELSASISKNSNARTSSGNHHTADRQNSGNARFADRNRNADNSEKPMGGDFMVQNTNGAPTGGYGQPLKTDRGLLGYILLSIITCGIYSYYFIYSVAQDVNVACRGDGKQTGGLLQFILLSIVTCGIYSLYWQYSLGNRLAANAPRYGMSFQENGTSILMWQLFGSLLCGIGPFIAMNIIIKNTNAICMAYNRANGYM